MMRSETATFGCEMHLVVRFRQPAHAFDRALHLARERTEIAGGAAHGRFEFAEREVLAERLHDLRWTSRSQIPSPCSLWRKTTFAVRRVRVQHRRGDEARGFVHRDRVIGVDDAGAKFDRGNVTFAGGAQAEDEAQFARRETGLVGVRDDRGIEERGGFERVFAGEERADVELAGFRERPAAEDVSFDHVEVPPPAPRGCPDGGSPKSVGDDGELRLDLGFAQGEGAPDDVDDARRVGRE